MPVLSNTRRERFAQEIAKGKTIIEAYEVAGYVPDDGNASKMAAYPEITARIQEITGKAAIRAEISVAKFTEDLLRIAKKAEDYDSAQGLAVSKGAIMDAAKLNGLVVDRSERGAPGEFADVDSMDAEQIRDFLARPPSPDKESDKTLN